VGVLSLVAPHFSEYKGGKRGIANIWKKKYCAWPQVK